VSAGAEQTELWAAEASYRATASAGAIVVSLEAEEAVIKPRTRQNRRQRVLQDVLINEAILAARLAEGVRSARELESLLAERLPQNSRETRERYAQSILRWFFGDGPDGLVTQVWRAYQDESLQRDILRVLYLRAEPIVGDCVAEALYPLADGMFIPPSYFDAFLAQRLGSTDIPEKTRERLKVNLGKLGFLARSRSRGDRLRAINPSKTAFLIMLHHLFAPEEPRTVELNRLFADPFWKYLGLKSEDSVRSILRLADAGQWIGKYVVADQLEQVTTCYSLKGLLSRRPVL
jgi:hypothetical protein